MQSPGYRGQRVTKQGLSFETAVWDLSRDWGTPVHVQATLSPGQSGHRKHENEFHVSECKMLSIETCVEMLQVKGHSSAQGLENESDI